MLVAYVQNSSIIKPYMDQYMKDNDLELIDFTSSIGRNIARGLEAQVVSEFIFDFMNELLENLKYYDEDTWTKYDFETLPSDAKGKGLFEVPRGVLCHFINIENKKVANYQAVVPTTWNASPKDSDNKRGPYEEALVGIKIKDIKEPLEVLRVVHSFDPCLACAVHIIDTKGKNLAEFKIRR
jgi:quinone-reactive Ni/Fe-hydrogenase large subunit